MTEHPTPICIGCNRAPSDLEEYIEASKEARAGGEEITPEQYVKLEEGTYNPENGHFLCTDCYIEKGMPTAPSIRWVAP